MGAPKQKWTPEEESALRAGVEKYGAGKWRAIQKDPKFSLILKSRSNVDLKDKWRNLSACQLPGGSRSAAKVAGLSPGVIRKQQLEPDMPLDMDPSVQFPDTGYIGMGIREPTPLKLPVEKNTLGSKYDDYILEAIAALNQPEGSDIGEISTYVEASHEVPATFRKFLNSKLKSLTLQGKLIKVDQNYKLSYGAPKRKAESDNNAARDAKRQRESAELRSRKPRMDLETAHRIVKEAEEASILAARAIAEAEATALAADIAAREAEAAELEAENLDAAADYAARPNRRSMRTAVPTLGGAFAVTV